MVPGVDDDFEVDVSIPPRDESIPAADLVVPEVQAEEVAEEAATDAQPRP